MIEALRGLERFTALEAEVDFERFLEVVRRAVETLRSEDVLDGQPGAFARRGVNVVAVNSLAGIEFERVWMLGATERAFPPPARQDPILLDPEREEISRRAGALLTPRGARGSEEELLFALACEAARERLVVSYARRATGENRPRLPSVFFRELASQLEGERVSAEERAAAQARRRRADPGRRDRRADPGRALRQRRGDGQPRGGGGDLAARARPHIPPGEGDRRCRDCHVRARRAAVQACARSDARALVAALQRVGRRARRCRAGRDRGDGAGRPDVLADGVRELREMPAAVPDGRAAPRPRRGGARADVPDRRASVAAACSTGSSSASTPNGTGRIRRRSRPGPKRGCKQSPSRSAMRRRRAARPGIRRCGRPTGSR